MRFKKYLPVALLAGVAMVSCQDDPENFDNAVFAPATNTVSQVAVRTTDSELTGYVSASIARKSDTDVMVQFGADPSKVELYNALYSQNAEMLPADYYTIPDPFGTIVAGANTTGQILVKFVNLQNLEFNGKIYVLPVSVRFCSVSATQALNPTSCSSLLRRAMSPTPHGPSPPTPGAPWLLPSTVPQAR